MKCPHCDSEDLKGLVQVEIWLPMAARGGSVKVGGHNITQVDLKSSWNKGAKTVGVATDTVGEDLAIRGPILCHGCEGESFYVSGAPSNPYKGSYHDAQELGAEHFVNGGTL